MDDQRFLNILGLDRMAGVKPPENIIAEAEFGMIRRGLEALGLPLLLKPKLIFVIAIDSRGEAGYNEGDGEALLAQLQNLRNFYSAPGEAYYVIRKVDDGDELRRIVESSRNLYGTIFVLTGMLVDDDSILSLDCMGTIRSFLEDLAFGDAAYFIASEPYTHSVYAEKVATHAFGYPQQKMA